MERKSLLPETICYCFGYCAGMPKRSEAHPEDDKHGSNNHETRHGPLLLFQKDMFLPSNNPHP